MISFEMPKPIVNVTSMTKMVAENMMRPVARYFDDHEHEIPWDYINFMHDASQQLGGGIVAEEPKEEKEEKPEKKKYPPIGYQRFAYMAEMLSWVIRGSTCVHL